MRKELFEELVESVKEMNEFRSGRREPARVTRSSEILGSGTPDVAALRARFKLSQAKFAALLGISLDTLQNWEQGRRQPGGAARVLLRVAAAHPHALLELTRPTKRRRRKRSVT